jgi:hypothetical protein
MTDKTADLLEVGDFVADMHYGLEPLRKRFKVTVLATWRHGPENMPFPPTVAGHLRMNKGLYVIGVTDHYCGVVCAYTYDGIRSGLIALED